MSRASLWKRPSLGMPAAVVVGLTAAVVPSASAAPVTVTFDSPGDHAWTVPAGADEAVFELFGGEGGAYNVNFSQAPGGKGARVTGTLAVTPGETLSLLVGGAGSANGGAGLGGGGLGGAPGGARGAGGGGASSVTRGTTRMLVAGGGGGGGARGGAGGAGGATGAAGAVGGIYGGLGGGGGLADAGGAGGAAGVMPAAYCADQTPGATGVDGAAQLGGQGAAAAHAFAWTGGGGGGGWFGGGGGGSGAYCPRGTASGGGGGGGGSSHVDSAVTQESMGTGDRSGHGAVAITVDDSLAPVANPVAAPEPGASGWSNEDVVVTWHWRDVGAAGLAAGACSPTSSTTGDGAGELEASCTDSVGNAGTATFPVKVDGTPPAIEISSPSGTYQQGEPAVAAFACTDATSGIATCEGTTSDGAPLDTSALGTHAVVVTASDVAGNVTTARAQYEVVARPPIETPEPPAQTLEAPTQPPLPMSKPAVTPESFDVDVPRRLVFGRSAQVRCGGTIDACDVRVRSRGTVVASGKAVAARRSARLRLTGAGRRLLQRHLGGVAVQVRVTMRAGGQRRTSTLRRRALLAVEHVTTPAGSWEPSAATLTRTGRRFVRALQRRAHALTGLRCDGHAAGETRSRANAYAISVERARTICRALRPAGAAVPVTVIGHGSARPLVNGTTEAAREVNRRVLITLRH